MNIKQAIDKSLLSLAEDRSNSTAKTYGYGIKQFVAFLETDQVYPVDDIDKLSTEHFIFFPGWLSSQKLKKNTKLLYMAGVRSFMEWLVIENHIHPTLAQELRYRQSTKKVMRKRESLLPKNPTLSEIEALRKAAKAQHGNKVLRLRDIALVEFMASTGCRVSEAANLLIGQIALSNRKAKVFGKGDKERIVFLSQEATDALREYWFNRGFNDSKNPAFMGHDYGWSSRKPKTISAKTVWLTIKELAKVAGIDDSKFSPGHLRHAFATRMLSETGNLAIVQDLMGHTSPATTRIYAKLTTQQLEDAHRKVYG